MEKSTSLNLLPFAINKLNNIESFAHTDGIVTHPPFMDEVFTTEMAEDLLTIYQQLYPNPTSIKCSQFFQVWQNYTLR